MENTITTKSIIRIVVDGSLTPEFADVLNGLFERFGDKVSWSYDNGEPIQYEISGAEVAIDAASRREDREWKQIVAGLCAQPSARGWAQRFSGADYIVPPTSTGADAQRRYESDMRGLVADGKVWDGAHGSANPKASSNALQVRPLLVVSFRESFTPAMSEVFKRNTKGIEERCGWVVVAVDCQDEAKVQAFAPGLPDINAMDTDEAITMLEALLEGLKRGRGDGGG